VAVRSNLAVNARAAGPRLGRGVQAVIRAAKAGDWSTDAEGTVVVRTDDGDVPMQPSEYELTTTIDVTTAEGEAPTLAAGVLPSGGFVVLDLALDEALLAEGYARDVVRAVQDARKAADLVVTDRIRLTLGVPAGHRAAVDAHREFIARETLATEVVVEDTDGSELTVGVERVAA
jgi:isoleucyl-tRNA synthetase